MVLHKRMVVGGGRPGYWLIRIRQHILNLLLPLRGNEEQRYDEEEQ